MKKIVLFSLFTLACVTSAEAGPKKVFKKIGHVIANHVTLDLAVGASSGAFAMSSFDCRHDVGPEPCTGHYGSLRGISIANGIFTGSMIAISEYGRKQGFREWFLPALATGLANTGWAVHEWTIDTKRRRDEDSLLAHPRGLR